MVGRRDRGVPGPGLLVPVGTRGLGALISLFSRDVDEWVEWQLRYYLRGRKTRREGDGGLGGSRRARRGRRFLDTHYLIEKSPSATYQTTGTI